MSERTATLAAILAFLVTVVAIILAVTTGAVTTWAVIAGASALLSPVLLLARGRWASVVSAALATVIVLGIIDAVTAAFVPPVDLATATPAEILTGYPLPPAPSLDAVLTAWRPSVVRILLLAGIAVGGLCLLLHARRHQRTVTGGRIVVAVIAFLLFAMISCGPVTVYGPVLFSVHATAGAILATTLPLLFALAAPGAMRRLAQGAGMLAHPLTAALVLLVALDLFFGTPLQGWALRDALGGDLRILVLLGAGTLFVAAVTSDDRRVMAIGAICTVVVVIAAAGVVLASGSALLVADWFGSFGRSWGAVPLDDQRAGALIAASLASLSLLALIPISRRRSRR